MGPPNLALWAPNLNHRSVPRGYVSFRRVISIEKPIWTPFPIWACVCDQLIHWDPSIQLRQFKNEANSIKSAWSWRCKTTLTKRTTLMLSIQALEGPLANEIFYPFWPLGCPKNSQNILCVLNEWQYKICDQKILITWFWWVCFPPVSSKTR